MDSNYSNSVVLITGGTGSFGGALTNHLLKMGAAEIRIFSRDEKKQEDMRIAYGNNALKFYVGDVREFQSINDAIRGVDYVFHAAALKQVPSCEFYPMQAVNTNIIGADNVMRASSNNNVKRCVVLSTDKAVYPINAMGISKSMMEKLMIARSREAGALLCGTRYGNVMASRGSVIPLFLKQILEKRPITLTDPNMTRFLMSLEDSVELVMHCFESSTPGDIYVQKSPAATMGDLAIAMMEIFSCNVPIQLIGTRHGEKLYETLVSREEMSRVVEEPSYFRIPSDNRDLNYGKYFVDGNITVNETQDYTSHNTKRLNVKEIKEILFKLDLIKGALLG